MTLKNTLTLILCLCCCLNLHAQAQRKTDVVTLYNGDRITGEVKSLNAGILRFSTDAMGTLRVEWQEIAKLESIYHYDIRLSDGTRYFGSFEHDAGPGQLTVKDIYGEHAVDWLQVVEIRPIEEKLLDRIDIYLSAGYSFDKASSVTQTTFNTVVSYENENSQNELTARSTLTDTDDETTSSARVNLGRNVWTDRSQLFTASFGNYETNDELGVDHRFALGAGLGRYFIDNHKTRLTGAAGLQLITENLEGDGEQQNVELFLSTRFRTWRFNTPELEVDTTLNLYPSITESGRLRSSADLRIRWEIIEDLFLDFTGFGSFDNQSESDDDFDYGLTTGLGWEY